jgi:hypothetical protein
MLYRVKVFEWIQEAQPASALVCFKCHFWAWLVGMMYLTKPHRDGRVKRIVGK